ANAVVMLGGMKELGAVSEEEHRAVLNMVQSFDFKMKVFVGQEFAFVSSQDPSAMWFATSEDAKQYFESNILKDCTILIKGSNSTKMGTLEETL
ncbi:MAG: hypothetical protein J5605_09175, partial [Bacteroidales bacterium]|nr:hypothetical protein [Bacteroidales bacterium]